MEFILKSVPSQRFLVLCLVRLYLFLMFVYFLQRTNFFELGDYDVGVENTEGIGTIARYEQLLFSQYFRKI